MSSCFSRDLSSLAATLTKKRGTLHVALARALAVGSLLSQMSRIVPNVGLLTYNDRVMRFEDYKIILYRQDDRSGWVAEIPALPACYALMKTREEALEE
jgi:hypothetical protein